MKKILNKIKKHKLLTIFLIIIIAFVVYLITRPPKEIKRDTVTVVPTVVEQDVDVAGRVEAATEVDLAVQTGGKVSSLNVKVGQKVKAGQMLLKVNDSDLQVRLARQEANLLKTRLALSKQESKTTSIDNLDNAYEEGLNIVSESFLDLTSIISGIDSIWSHEYLAENTVTLRYGTQAQTRQMNAKKLYYVLKSEYEKLSFEYRSVNRDSNNEDIQSLIEHTYDVTKTASDAVKSVNTLLNYIELESERNVVPAGLAGDRATIDSFTTQINRHLSGLLNIKNTIKKSTLGITDENTDIESLKIDIRQAELDIQDTRVQISNRTIYAPIGGVVTDLKTKIGETISGGVPVISLISANQYQITVDLPESEIAKVTIGADAEVKLDAYGDSAVFEASVVSIDPTATILNGVATYKTTLLFNEKDDRIKSGMTADLTIKGERKENVLAVPQRAIISKENKKYVEVLEGENVIEKEVKTGLRGSNGSVEVSEGLIEGEKVIVFTESK